MDILILNLEHREDRRKSIQSHLRHLDIHDYEFIEAVAIPDNPEMGCRLSHLKALQYAKDNGFVNVLVLEDDARIRSKEALLDLMDSVGSRSWNLVFLGITRGRGLKLLDKGFVKLKYSPNPNYLFNQEAFVTSSHAILYNLSDEEIFTRFESCLQKPGHVDLNLSDEFCHATGNGGLLVPVPFVADFIECGPSDIRQGQSISVDIEHLRETEKKLQMAMEKYYQQ
jgi:hypothetical protein